MTPRQIEVVAKVKQIVERAESLYNIKFPYISIRFDLSGRGAGQAGRNNFVDHYLRFNNTMMENDSWEHIINETVPHEVAHLVCMIDPRLGKNHDTGWKKVCLMLGGNGKRCHSEPTVYKNGWTYISTTGKSVPVSAILHKKILSGTTYRIKNAGLIHKECYFSKSI